MGFLLPYSVKSVRNVKLKCFSRQTVYGPSKLKEGTPWHSEKEHTAPFHYGSLFQKNISSFKWAFG